MFLDFMITWSFPVLSAQSAHWTRGMQQMGGRRDGMDWMQEWKDVCSGWMFFSIDSSMDAMDSCTGGRMDAAGGGHG